MQVHICVHVCEGEEDLSILCKFCLHVYMCNMCLWYMWRGAVQRFSQLSSWWEDGGTGTDRVPEKKLNCRAVPVSFL